MFCGHEGEARYMTHVEGEGWECNGTYRCLRRQEERFGQLEEFDHGPRWEPGEHDAA